MQTPRKKEQQRMLKLERRAADRRAKAEAEAKAVADERLLLKQEEATKEAADRRQGKSGCRG
jgi:hypothetical protein